MYAWRDEDAEVSLREFAPRARLLSSRAQSARTVKDVAALVANDLEPSVVAREPRVGELIARLREAGALAAAMTGSGAAVFGVFASEVRAKRAREAVAPARAWYVTDLQPGAPKAPAPRGARAEVGAARACYAVVPLRGGRPAASRRPCRSTLGRSQVVRHRVLVPASGGSNPPAPASVTSCERRRVTRPASASR